MSKTRVLFVSQEIVPFSPDSLTAASSRQIPQAVHERGKETRIFMPRYGKINERRHQLHEVIRLSGMNLIVDDTDHPLIIKVAVKKLGWAPDIIHCHGWFTSLMPLYVKKLYGRDPHFADTKVVFSAYDDAFTGTLDKTVGKKVSFDNIEASDLSHLSNPSHVNLIKTAIQHSDGFIIGHESVPSELEQFALENDVPVLRSHTENEPHVAIDEFFDSVHAGKSVLVD